MRQVETAALAGAVLLLASGAAQAHSFAAGADIYDAFVAGAAVMLAAPATLLPLMALGLLLSSWHSDGMVRAWPVFLAGQLAGIVLAPFVGLWITNALLIFGCIVAVLVALLPRHVRPEVLALAAIGGAGSTAYGLEGHALFELPVMIHLGIIFATNLIAAAAAALMRAATDRFPGQIMSIGWRVAASWLAAVQVLLLAFLLRPGG